MASALNSGYSEAYQTHRRSSSCTMVKYWWWQTESNAKLPDAQRLCGEPDLHDAAKGFAAAADALLCVSVY